MLGQSATKAWIALATLLTADTNVVAWTVGVHHNRAATNVVSGRRCMQPSVARQSQQGRGGMMTTTTTTSLRMALDYNDPVVAEEFATVQSMEFEEVEEELMESGIPVSATMNDMDAKLMLVEVRLRRSGRMPGNEKAAAPQKTSFASKYEEAMYTKPQFKKLVDEYKQKGDQNAVNVAVEYLDDKATALKRYGESYRALIRDVERALTAPPPVKSKLLKFSGFPANMGEAACKMTLEALGPIVSFECEESEDFPVLAGKVEFEDIDDAKKAVKQYNGMDMGMGTKLELMSV